MELTRNPAPHPLLIVKCEYINIIYKIPNTPTKPNTSYTWVIKGTYLEVRTHRTTCNKFWPYLTFKEWTTSYGYLSYGVGRILGAPDLILEAVGVWRWWVCCWEYKSHQPPTSPLFIMKLLLLIVTLALLAHTSRWLRRFFSQRTELGRRRVKGAKSNLASLGVFSSGHKTEDSALTFVMRWCGMENDQE